MKGLGYSGLAIVVGVALNVALGDKPLESPLAPVIFGAILIQGVAILVASKK